MKKILLSILAVIFFMIFSVSSSEAKVLPQATKSAKQSVSKSSSGITVSPRFRADRRAVVVNFSNLQNAQSVSYTLTYTQKGQEEGAIGTLNPTSSTASQELLFGTCSKNVCRYHSNISNVKLEVLYTLKSGKKYVKRYRLKI